MQKIDFTSPLDKLSAIWGNVPDDWSILETLERIEFISDQFDRNQAVNLDINVLRELLKVYQDSLELKILLGENEVFVLNPTVTNQTLLNLRQDTEGTPTVRVYFRINKTRLAELYYSDIYNSISEPKCFYVYIYVDQFIDFLKNSRLEDLENRVWKGIKDSVVVFLLPNTESYLVGQRLVIMGGSKINPEGISELSNWNKKEIDLANQANKVCRANLKWQESWLNFITPWHLFVSEKDASPLEIKKTFAGHFGNAFLLYTADFTFTQKKDGCDIRVSRYSSPDKNLELIHNFTTLPSDFQEKQENLLSILNWIYDRQWSTNDRLTLAQINIIDQLFLVEINDRSQSLFAKAETIQKNIDWHWETFTKKKIDIYMREVKDLESYLSDLVDSYSTNIALIQKTLSDTMLAAVGVWASTFIVSLFSKPFNPIIFQAGLIGYSLYMLFFPLLYNMIQRWKEFKQYQERSDAMKQRFLEYLPSSKVNEIFQDWKVKEVKCRFVSTFRLNIGIYLLVILVSISAAFILPGWIINYVS